MKKSLLQQLVKKSLATLSGDWVIIGGTVLPLVGVEHRHTVDIDMLPLKSAGNQASLALMELAESLGLPVEAINSAGLFFLRKIKDWEERLVLHAESKKCRIYRPNFDLYLELKLARFSEADEADVVAYFKWHKSKKLSVDIERSQKLIQKKIKISQSEQKRLQAILNLIK